MQSVSSRIWTRVAVSISYDDNDFTSGTSIGWTAIDRLSIIWKSDLTQKKEMQFLPGSGRIDTAIWMHYLDANKTAEEETRQQLHKNVKSNIEQVLATTPYKTPTIRPLASHHENYTS